MNHVRRNIKFKDRVQVLEFKKTQFVANLLKGAKKGIPLNEGESEYTKKRRQEKEAMKKSGKSRVPKEHVGIVLARQKEIEAQFLAAYCRMVWAKIKKLSQEACYGCNHRRLDKRDHVTCQMSDVDCIRRFMEMALGDVRCFDVMREWYDALSGLKPPLSENEVLLYDAPWVLERIGHPDRILTLRELMIGDVMDDDLEPFPSMTDDMTDEELLEAVDAMETQHNNNNTTQQSESTDAMQQSDMTFDYAGEFLDPAEEEGEEPKAFIPFPDCWGCVNFLPSQDDHACLNYGQFWMDVLEEEEGEEPELSGIVEEEEKRNEAFIPLNSDCCGCVHCVSSQKDHACCNYGNQEEPEEDITDVQEGVCIRFCSLLLWLFFLFILSIFFGPPEQFFPGEPIWEWSQPRCPLYFDEDE